MKKNVAMALINQTINVISQKCIFFRLKLLLRFKSKILKAFHLVNIKCKISNIFYSFQGEYQLRLRELEKELLDKLNNVQGRILDDDSVITALETLKKEADQVQQKVLETDVIMGEVTSVSMKYEPLARSCSDIFFTLESMSQLHFLYQVQYFLIF